METYKQRLDRLGREAWSNAKEALRNLGGEFLLPRPVDLLTRNQHDWNTVILDAHKVCLSGDTLLILSSQDLSLENINWDDVTPSEVWSEDGDEEQTRAEFGIQEGFLDTLIGKEHDDDGRVHFTWGGQRIS